MSPFQFPEIEIHPEKKHEQKSQSFQFYGNPLKFGKTHPQDTSQKRQTESITVHGGEVIIPCVKAGPSHPRSALDGRPRILVFGLLSAPTETGSYHKP